MLSFIQRNLMYPGGDTNTTGAFEVVQNHIFGQRGDREGIRDVLVMLTDGIPTFPEPNPKSVPHQAGIMT